MKGGEGLQGRLDECWGLKGREREASSNRLEFRGAVKRLGGSDEGDVVPPIRIKDLQPREISRRIL